MRQSGLENIIYGNLKVGKDRILFFSNNFVGIERIDQTGATSVALAWCCVSVILNFDLCSFHTNLYLVNPFYGNLDECLCFLIYCLVNVGMDGLGSGLVLQHKPLGK